MTMELSLALLALSAPITVAIVKFRPRTPQVGGVTPREFRIFVASVRDNFDMLRADIRELRSKIDERL